MTRLLRRIRLKLAGRRVGVRLMVEPPKPVGEGWLLRLRCQNPGRPDSFDASIVAIEPDAGATLPWPLAWRGHATSTVHLQTRGGELLRVALFPAETRSAFVLLGAGAPGTAQHRCPMEVNTRDTGETDSDEIERDGGFVLTVRIRRRGRTEVEQRIRLTSRAGRDGAFVPKITLVA